MKFYLYDTENAYEASPYAVFVSGVKCHYNDADSLPFIITMGGRVCFGEPGSEHHEILASIGEPQGRAEGRFWKKSGALTFWEEERDITAENVRLVVSAIHNKTGINPNDIRMFLDCQHDGRDRRGSGLIVEVSPMEYLSLRVPEGQNRRYFWDLYRKKAKISNGDGDNAAVSNGMLAKDVWRHYQNVSEGKRRKVAISESKLSEMIAGSVNRILAEEFGVPQWLAPLADYIIKRCSKFAWTAKFEKHMNSEKSLSAPFFCFRVPWEAIYKLTGKQFHGNSANDIFIYHWDSTDGAYAGFSQIGCCLYLPSDYFVLDTWEEENEDLRPSLMHELTHYINGGWGEHTKPEALGDTFRDPDAFVPSLEYLFSNTEMNARIAELWGTLHEYSEAIMEVLEEEEIDMNSPKDVIAKIYDEVCNFSLDRVYLNDMAWMYNKIVNEDDSGIYKGYFSFSNFNADVEDNVFCPVDWDVRCFYFELYDEGVTTNNNVLRIPNKEYICNLYRNSPEKAFNYLKFTITSQLRKKLENFRKRVYRVIYEFYKELRSKNDDGGLSYSQIAEMISESIRKILSEKGIHIKEKNRGKFTATKERTGKSTEELTHSKNPLTRKRAIFAQNAKKWNKK